MEQLLLLRGVREVSEQADPNAPTTLSQRAFDEARAGSSFPDLPPARNIARTLGVSWAEVLDLAHESEAVRTKRLGRQQGENDPQDWLTAEYVVFALRLMAHRLGTRSLSLSQYRTEREKMLAADRAHWLHGRRLLLPNEEQVITYVGSWPKALLLAGLEPAPQGLKQDATNVPTLVELIERFHEHYGTRPTKPALESFAAGNGIPYRRKPFGEALAQWQATRSAHGLPAAAEPPPINERPDYSRDVGAARPDERRLHAQRTQKECIAWMRRYLEDLPAGARSTQRSYRDWSRQQDGAPGASTIGRHGGFNPIRTLAQDEMHAASKS